MAVHVTNLHRGAEIVDQSESNLVIECRMLRRCESESPLHSNKDKHDYDWQTGRNDRSAAFERLATAILREAEPQYASLLHPGVNKEGKTVVAGERPLNKLPVTNSIWTASTNT
jgi:hypothetical protein